MTTYKVYTCDCFEGHYPVGSAAVIVAPTIEDAAHLLELQLESIGLEQRVPTHRLTEVDTTKRSVDVLVDGDY